MPIEGRKPPKILVFSHLLAYLETWKLEPDREKDWLVSNEKVNLEALRQVWKIITTYL